MIKKIILNAIFIVFSLLSTTQLSAQLQVISNGELRLNTGRKCPWDNTMITHVGSDNYVLWVIRKEAGNNESHRLNCNKKKAYKYVLENKYSKPIGICRKMTINE